MKVFDAPALRRAVGFADLIEPVAQIFAEFSQGRGQAPIQILRPAGDQGDAHVKSACMPGRSIFTVKVATWFAAAQPPTGGFIAALDARTGAPLALLRDEHHLTDVRTAAAGAVAARALARPDAAVLTVAGTGAQAYLQALATCAVLPIEQVIVWGRRESAATAVCAALAARLPDRLVRAASDAKQAVRQADVIVTATSSTTPILAGQWLRPGQHVTAVGADDPAKAELDAACFHRADLVVADSRQAARQFAGDLRAAGADVDAELGELLLGRHPGRADRSQITIAKLVGLGIQDLVAAETALRLLEHGPPERPAPASAHDLA
ncbi:ornithine cyclodeaminase family protein [Nonomuraea guangzhouensis]|uniref:Ornithine cyclodeaminase family protein n=1 Tax=Nonomuraea guangzhouensis TaxID=1291555 RepID=A0ABW4G3W9_9ACTN|nr:ornithine cyclodeaminase family protein [Nonomuraea guangzhouensis]